MKSRRSEVIGVILLIVGFVLAVAGIAILLQRNEFKSVVRVEVQTPPSNPNVYDPYFLLTEFETVQSHEVLGKVITALSLNERWGKKYNHGQRLSDSEIEQRIKRHLQLRNIRNTKFIEIAVFDDDPVEAAQLANAIAQSYSQFRKQEYQSRTTEAANAGAIIDFMVPVTDHAVPEMQPVGPNRYLAWVMLGCGMFLMIVGFVCLTCREV